MLKDDNIMNVYYKFYICQLKVSTPYSEFLPKIKAELNQLGEDLPEKKHREVAEEGLQRFDLDNNGKIDYNEFFDFINFVVSEKGYTL